MAKVLYQYKRSLLRNLTLIDDLLATGGAIECVANLIRKSGKEVIGSVTVVELVELNGRCRFNFPVESMLRI